MLVDSPIALPPLKTHLYSEIEVSRAARWRQKVE